MSARCKVATIGEMGDEVVKRFKLISVTPLSLGIDCLGDVMEVMIPRNSLVPIKKEKTFRTIHDNQTVVSFPVYQGERSKSTDNFFLGKLELSGLPCAPQGEVKVKVCFEIDVNGILNVSATELTTGVNNAIKILADDDDDDKVCSLSAIEIEKMIEDGERYKVEDEAYVKEVKANRAIEKFAIYLKGKAKDWEDIEYMIEDTIDWLDETSDANIDQLEDIKMKLLDICRRMEDM